MGWVNYIVMNEYKLLIEVSRETEDTNYDELFEFDEYADIDKDFKNVSLKDLVILVKCQDLLSNINIDKLLLYILRRYDNVELITEFEYTENKEKYNDFRIMRKQ